MNSDHKIYLQPTPGPHLALAQRLRHRHPDRDGRPESASRVHRAVRQLQVGDPAAQHRRAGGGGLLLALVLLLWAGGAHHGKIYIPPRTICRSACSARRSSTC